VATKAEKLAQVEDEYKKHLEDIESEGDDSEDGDGEEDAVTITLKGQAKQAFLDSLAALGLTGEKAKEKEEDISGDGDGKKTGKDKKEPPVKDDPKPPPRSKYFQSRG
jgi:hypothetical protein